MTYDTDHVSSDRSEAPCQCHCTRCHNGQHNRCMTECAQDRDCMDCDCNPCVCLPNLPEVAMCDDGALEFGAVGEIVARMNAVGGVR